jgi:hypothetical protein
MGYEEAIGAAFLRSVGDELRRHKDRAERAMAQVRDEAKLHWTPDGESNSIAVLVRHLSGNMLSRWSDFLTTDGEKATRDRDAEFEAPAAMGRDAILAEWERGWTCLLATVTALNPADLTRTVTIRSKPLSAMEAIVQQAMHYAGHVGQIVFLAKQVTGEEWKSLSIPKKRA